MSTLRVCLPKNPTSAKRHLLLHHSRTTPPPLDLLLVCKDFETFFAVLSIVRSPLPQIRGILAHYLQQRCPPQQTLLLPPSSSTPTTVAADGTNPDHYHHHHHPTLLPLWISSNTIYNSTVKETTTWRISSP